MLRFASRADEKRISLRAVRPSREALRRDRAIALAEAGGPAPRLYGSSRSRLRTNRAIIFFMPIFEYACLECDKRFETLVLGSSADAPRCPSCESERLEKQLSVFAVNTGNGSSAAREVPGSCGSCGDPRGPGSCSMN